MESRLQPVFSDSRSSLKAGLHTRDIEMTQSRITPALICFLVLALILRGGTSSADTAKQTNPVRTEYALDIVPVWAGHPVGFCLLTAGEHQFVAFYDAERHMTVASRKLDAREWQFKRLPSAGEPEKVIRTARKLERSAEYEVMSHLTEADARAEAVRKIARKVVSHMFETW